jgi:hypothetical protein
MRREQRLAQGGPLRAGVDWTAGYAYASGLSDAIVQVLAARAAELSHKGIDLAPAIQRSLYIDLVNRPQLYDAFRTRDPALVAVANPLEAEVASLLCPGARIEILERPRLLQAAARARNRVRSRAAGVQAGRPGAVLSLLVHPKFERFLRPVLDRLPEGSSTLLQTFAAADSAGRPQLALDWSEPPRGRLRSYPELVALASALDRIVRETRPRLVLGVEGNAPPDAVLAGVARARDVPSIVVQQGWPAFVHAGFRSIPFDRMLVWGRGFADCLAPHNPSLRFDAVGCHVIEPVTPDGAPREAVSFFLQTTSELLAPEHVEAMVELAVEVAGADPGRRVYVREHPGHPLGQATRQRLAATPGIVLADPADVPLAQVLRESAVAVSTYSTTLFEAVAAGVPPVSFNPTSLPGLTPSLEAYGAGIEVKDAAAARAAIERLASGAGVDQLRPGMERLREEFFSALGQEAADRAAAAILGR